MTQIKVKLLGPFGSLANTMVVSKNKYQKENG